MVSSSVYRKFFMALSGIFLIVFLTQHLIINLTSIISVGLFNQISHFMGTNPIVQYFLQPVLILGVIFHFVMGFLLELKNNKARLTGYSKPNIGSGSSWASRNMIITGVVILSFLCAHLYDFWLHEISQKYIQGDMSGLGPDGEYRYWRELNYKFQGNLFVVVVYCVSFFALGLHLAHGFTSSIQSIGLGSRRVYLIQKIGQAYSFLVPAGFTIIAMYHYLC